MMGKRAAVRSASTPCQLRVTSFASKFRLLDRHPLDVPTRAAPHVHPPHYGPRFAHNSKEYGHRAKITSDWQDHDGLANAIGYCEAVGRGEWDVQTSRIVALVVGVGGREGTRCVGVGSGVCRGGLWVHRAQGVCVHCAWVSLPAGHWATGCVLTSGYRPGTRPPGGRGHTLPAPREDRLVMRLHCPARKT